MDDDEYDIYSDIKGTDPTYVAPQPADNASLSQTPSLVNPHPSFQSYGPSSSLLQTQTQTQSQSQQNSSTSQKTSLSTNTLLQQTQRNNTLKPSLDDAALLSSDKQRIQGTNKAATPKVGQAETQDHDQSPKLPQPSQDKQLPESQSLNANPVELLPQSQDPNQPSVDEASKIICISGLTWVGQNTPLCLPSDNLYTSFFSCALRSNNPKIHIYYT
jgi:hypothetical protein